MVDRPDGRCRTVDGAADGSRVSEGRPIEGRRRGRNDPQRAERLVEAALRVIARAGVEGLSHRAVAAEAGVPLGSTTYYFGSLDDLLIAATERAMRDDTASLSAWAAAVPRDGDLAVALADRVIEQSAAESEPVVNYRLYLAAERGPAMARVGYEWSAVRTRILGQFVDRATADVLSALYEALIMRVLISGRRFGRDDVERVFRRALEHHSA